MFQGLSQKIHVLGALSPSYKKTKFKNMDLRYFLTENLGFSIGARLRLGQNLGRSETQTPLVTSGGLSKDGADLTFQCNKKTSSETLPAFCAAPPATSHVRSAHTAAAVGAAKFIPVPLAACGKAHLKCRLTGEAH